MEPIHIFYNELEIDGSNVFTANVSQEIEVGNVSFNKNKECAVTGMTIKPDIVDSDIVKVTDQKKLESLSKRIQELVERKKEPDLDLKIVNPETKTVTIPFQKISKKGCLPIKLVFYNTKTEKDEEILF